MLLESLVPKKRVCELRLKRVHRIWNLPWTSGLRHTIEGCKNFCACSVSHS